MNRLFNYTVLFATLFLSSMSFSQVVHGVCKLTNVAVNELTCFGAAELNNVTIKGALSVFGTLSMIKTAVNGSIDVKGSFSSTNSVVKGPVITYGPISATTTVFNSNIISYTTDIVLNASEVKGSLSIESKDKIPTLQLIDHTIVTGNVTFSKQAGIIKLDPGSQVLGSVTNGTKQNGQ